MSDLGRALRRIGARVTPPTGPALEIRDPRVKGGPVLTLTRAQARALRDAIDDGTFAAYDAIGVTVPQNPSVTEVTFTLGGVTVSWPVHLWDAVVSRLRQREMTLTED